MGEMPLYCLKACTIWYLFKNVSSLNILSVMSSLKCASIYFSIKTQSLLALLIGEDFKLMFAASHED